MISALVSLMDFLGQIEQFAYNRIRLLPLDFPGIKGLARGYALRRWPGALAEQCQAEIHRGGTGFFHDLGMVIIKVAQP